ncbi:MAG TPA: hypothetical protein VL947_06515, partial [Cytophagales bacterium]|nr:hypothetical protein [Cytophagales bacterium]
MIINLFTFWTRRRRSIYWITLLMGVISTATYVQAQTVALPDSGFCKCLKATRPQVIDANNELIILEAIKVQSIQCQNYNIKNVEGLQYFIKSTYIGLQDNQIDSLPDLDGYQLPFTANAVFILDMGGNQLKHLPKLPTTLPIILDLKINKLASLPAVDAPQNIRSLNIQMNPGMTLPDLSAFVNLEQLYASFTDWDAFP